MTELDRVWPLARVQKKLGLSVRTFERFRKRHGIRVLTGGLVHLDDIEAAFAAERGITKSRK